MRNGAQGVLAFLAILATCVAAMLRLSPWAPVACACVLGLISISNHQWAGEALGWFSGGSHGVLMLSSALNATATAFGAFALGHGLAWIAGI